MTQPDRATRRATVRRLADDGNSGRVIATRLGISEATVRRDLAATAQPAAPHDASPASPSSPTAPDDAPPAPGDAPDHAPAAPPSCATAAPPLPPGPDGTWLTLPIDSDLSSHLAVLMTAGHDITEAVRAAIEQMADAYRSAWDYGLCPRGQQPRIVCHSVITTEDRPAPLTPLDKISA